VAAPKRLLQGDGDDSQLERWPGRAEFVTFFSQAEFVTPLTLLVCANSGSQRLQPPSALSRVDLTNLNRVVGLLRGLGLGSLLDVFERCVCVCFMFLLCMLCGILVCCVWRLCMVVVCVCNARPCVFCIIGCVMSHLHYS
jgi:hypothetical protein